MLVPLEWLADFVDHGLSTDELAHRLTMIGLNVESIHRPAASWGDIVVGHVVALEPHRSSRNPLNVAQVDVGTHEITIVTGAPNVQLGDKVPTILVGGSVPHGPDGDPMTIVAKPMAGITSEGMLCSARELGLSDEHTGIYILAPDASVGALLSSILGGDVLDVETVSNRPDTLSMLGIAREVAAATGQRLLLPDMERMFEAVQWLPETSMPVQIDVPEWCPRFSVLRIDGVSAVDSPTWLASRLTAAGQRPINLLVDLTNYVMLETGQPMHAFDADRLTGTGIVVREAGLDETLRTLDGVDRVLPAHTVVVADGDRAVSVAGIIGGEESEITPQTSSLLLEAACWNAPHTRATARALGLRTEASSRFEKGQPPEATVRALWRYVQLLAEITGERIRACEVSDAYPRPPEERIVRMPYRDLERLVGIEISPETAAWNLSLLGFRVTLEDDALSAVVPPWRRVDIEQSADLVEEVARFSGFDLLPATLPRRTMRPPSPDEFTTKKAEIRERLLSGGVNEITTHSLTSPAALGRMLRSGASSSVTGTDWEEAIPNKLGIEAQRATVEFVRLRNPATVDRSVLRLSLLPSVLDVLARNMKQQDERLAFFELDRTFFARADDLPYERETLALALSGLRLPRTWSDPQPGPFTFFDTKGLLESLLHLLRITDWQVTPRAHPALHPGRSAALLVNGGEVGIFGELHPDVAATFGLESHPVQIAELDLHSMIGPSGSQRPFKSLPRFPAVYRDLAAVVDRDLPVARLLDIVRREGGELLESARVFDVYAGSQVPAGKKSIAVELAFRSHEETLIQDDVSAIMDAMVQAMSREVFATLRE